VAVAHSPACLFAAAARVVMVVWSLFFSTRFKSGFDRVLFGFQAAPFLAGGSRSLLRRRWLFRRAGFVFFFCYVGVRILLCCVVCVLIAGLWW